MVTAAAPVEQPTGTAIRTMMQLAPSSDYGVMRVHEWGFSLSTYANGGQVELLDTGTVFATLNTAYALADVQPHNDATAPANTSGSSGLPLNLGTALSAFATGSTTEGSITATLMKDYQTDPQGPYVKQWPLGLEPEIAGGHAMRVRATFATTTNMTCYVIVSFGL
jgi:hypothetical protein